MRMMHNLFWGIHTNIWIKINKSHAYEGPSHNIVHTCATYDMQYQAVVCMHDENKRKEKQTSFG